jgi:hypothetical protein
MVTTTKELDAWDWMNKINEKLTFILLNAKEKREITEADYDLLKILFRVWDNQEYPIYESVMDGVEEVATQQNLFTDISSCVEVVKMDGMDVAIDNS